MTSLSRSSCSSSGIPSRRPSLNWPRAWESLSSWPGPDRRSMVRMALREKSSRWVHFSSASSRRLISSFFCLVSRSTRSGSPAPFVSWAGVSSSSVSSFFLDREEEMDSGESFSPRSDISLRDWIRTSPRRLKISSALSEESVPKAIAENLPCPNQDWSILDNLLI